MSHDREFDAPEFTTAQGCDCTSLCSMGPTCPGGMLAGLAGSGCWRTTADLCNECNCPVPEDDAGPSCGAHVLHVECAHWFGCRECYLVRAEIP